MASMWNLSGLTVKELAVRTWGQIQKDRVMDQAAKLAFYFLLAIFPFLLFLIALLGFFLKSGSTYHQELLTYLSTVAPEMASSLIQSTLAEVTQGSSGGKMSVGLIFTLWAASAGMVALIEALNIAYEVKEKRAWWKQRLTAVILTVIFFVMIVLALFLIIYGEQLAQLLAARLGFSPYISTLWQVLEWALLLAVLLLVFNLVYYYAPNVKRRQWHWLMPGTVAGVLLWLIVSSGFKLYLTYFNRYSVTYGSIGAVIILLLWFYLTGMAILVGGEINSEIEKASGEVEECPES